MRGLRGRGGRSPWTAGVTVAAVGGRGPATTPHPVVYTRGRMSRLLPAKIVAAMALLLAAPACAKKIPPPAVTVVEDEGGGGGSGGDVVAEPAKTRPPPQGKPVQVQASVEGLGDLLQLIKLATTAWNPKNPIDANAWVQAALLQFGYGPGMWTSLDLAGVMAADSTFFPEDPTNGLRLTGSLAALSPKGIMDGMPSTRRPQPLGNGLWELVEGDLRVLLREQAKSLEFALSPTDLERASAVAKAAVGGRRLEVHASDLPRGVLSADLIPMLPAALRRQVSAILGETTRASLELDAGTDRDLVLAVTADAPFERLGLGPLGAARTQTSALEGRLPAGAALVVALPWGNPELLHKMLTNMEKLATQAGAGFEAAIKSTMQASHAILDQVQHDVVFAVYPGPRGELTVLIAADVKDEVAARKAMHDILATANTAVATFNTLGGNKKEASFTVSLKANGIKAGGVEGELFSLGLPKNMASDLEEARPMLTDKQQIEIAAVTAGGSAVLTLGYDAKKIATDVAGGLKPGARKTSLATDGGLALARSASQGCHFCISISPAAMARVALFSDETMRSDKKRLKDLDDAAAVVTRVGGALGLGVRLDPKQGALAAGLSKSLLVLTPADAAQVGKLWESVAPPPPPEDKPLGGGSKGLLR